MDKYIYIKNNSLPDLLCDEIIEKFEEQDDKYDGETFGGVIKEIKDTTDYLIPKSKDDLNNHWKDIEECLYKELYKEIKEYKKSINIDEYSHLLLEFHTDFFMVQKYKKGIGKYVYHTDGHNDIAKKRTRVITFLWYLNDVLEGGETEFINLKINPRKGTLLLFPSTWNYPHRGNMPISSDKYIITGWLYIFVK
jgi:Rps23 Pro-64 3,4-dihydroxylase Tpa1-like proline 4-hydroxylase